MFPNSIRWRLPLSYAVLALLTSLVLGVLLLVMLQRYYRQQELDYLTHNAQSMSRYIVPWLETNHSIEPLQTELGNFAFLSQTRIRVFNTEDQLLIDTGKSTSQQHIVALSLDVDIDPTAATQTITQSVAVTDPENKTSVIVIKNNETRNYIDPEDSFPLDQILPDLSQNEGVIINRRVAITTSDFAQLPDLVSSAMSGEDNYLLTSLAAAGTPYGFSFNPEASTTEPRSTARIQHSIYNNQGELLGYIDLSEGPAYGRQILQTVAWGWAIASIVATLFAATIGWRLSRQLSHPIIGLTDATKQMGAGDLSIRADIDRHDELGVLAEQFNKMAYQVEDTVLTLRRFSADAAHQLQTPLTALKTNLELITEDDSDKDHRQPMVQALSQVDQLEALTNDLLMLSRVEANITTTPWGPIDLSEQLQIRCEQYASQAEQAGILFTYQAISKPIIIRGDTAQLTQVWHNLLDNAIKFTPDGGTILVRLESHPDTGWADVEIIDTGIGITVAETPYLFNRFYRGKQVTSYPGNGLGLAIVQSIVTAHDGQVEVIPSTKGAWLRVRLPLCREG
ncbi:MAG: HAMP domain-containing sensor histidine kinase [Chloroflexota bacterium]